MITFIIGVVIGLAIGAVGIFLIWKNNQDRMQALGEKMASKMK